MASVGQMNPDEELGDSDGSDGHLVLVSDDDVRRREEEHLIAHSLVEAVERVGDLLDMHGRLLPIRSSPEGAHRPLGIIS